MLYEVITHVRFGWSTTTRCGRPRITSYNVCYTKLLRSNQSVADGIPARRFGSPVEIGETAAFLLSDGAGYITGQNLRVDGGLSRSV